MDLIRGRAIAITELVIGTAVFLVLMFGKPKDGGPIVFFTIADKIASGAVPYKDWPYEYPPLSLIPIGIPRLIGGIQNHYQVPFLIFALITTLAVGVALVWLADRGWSSLTRNGTLIAFTALVLAAWPQVMWRFDIFAALFALLALVALVASRPAAAGVSLGLGMATKLYPAFLMPVFFAYYAFARRWRSAAMVALGFVAFLAVVAGLLMLMAGRNGFTFLTYQEDRGIEIESVLAGLVMLAHNLLDAPAVVTFGYGSYQVQSSVISALTVPNAIALLGLGALLAVTLSLSFDWDARRFGTVRPRTMVSYLLATLLLVMVANKVLSPQYVAWLIPFGALLPWRQSLLLVVICALTTLEYPLAFDALRKMELWVVVALNVRNLLMVVLFFWLIVPRRRADEASDRQMVAMLEMPPRSPAATPNISSPIASFFRRGAMTTISTAAKPTVRNLATVRPGMPTSWASIATMGFASEDRPWRSIITRKVP